MNKTTRRFSIALAAAASLACAVPAAFAAGTFTVTAGSATTLDNPIVLTAATSGAAPQVHLTADGSTFTCDSSSMPGSTAVGAGLSGADILTLDATSATWTNCQGAGFTFTVTSSSNWPFNATAGSSTGVSGNLGLNLSMTGTNSFGATCNFTIAGLIANYDNAAATLGIDDTSTISGVSGTCESLGVIKNGDRATFQANYVVTASNSAYNPIHITQS